MNGKSPVVESTIDRLLDSEELKRLIVGFFEYNPEGSRIAVAVIGELRAGIKARRCGGSDPE